jgi:hypothetical protein
MVFSGGDRLVRRRGVESYFSDARVRLYRNVSRRCHVTCNWARIDSSDVLQQTAKGTMSRRGWMMGHVENNVLSARIGASTSFDAAATAVRDPHAGKVNRSRPEGIFAGKSCADLPPHRTNRALICQPSEPIPTQESDLCHAPYKREKAK